MARLTTEDCLQNVPNLFNLVLLAARRAHQLEAKEAPTVPEDGDKPTVVALREIAAGTVDAKSIAKTDRDIADREAVKSVEWAAPIITPESEHVEAREVDA